MGMDIDKTRRHQLASSIDLFAAQIGPLPNRDNLSGIDEYIALVGDGAISIGDQAAPDCKVDSLSHGSTSSSLVRRMAARE